ERLRNTSEMVSGLSLRERLFYSICSIIRISSSTLGATDGSGGIRYPYQELLKEVCRVLTLSQNKIEEEIRDLAETGLVKIENVSGGDDTASLLVPDFEVFSGFVDFLSEQLSHLPGFPVPSRKYLVLTGKSQEILFFLKNKSADLPMDKDGRSHYNFDLYVSESVESLGCGVKDAILDIQKIAASGTIKLAKNSEVVGNKAIVYDVEDVSRAQLILLQAEEFNKIYKDIRKKN
ncbi:MAG: hypothetical protein U9N45_05800, partial [Gemmatimonadota bacterium]|nr:hypothetical protein [Gemmatimonadota bacterium]